MPTRHKPRLDDANRIRNALYDLHLSQRAAARLLDLDDRMMRYYCAGEFPVPRMVWLALEALGNRYLQAVAQDSADALDSSPEGERTAAAAAPGPAAPEPADKPA
jgi:hypothetical protein